MRWGQVAVTSLKNLCPDINNIDLKRDYITTPSIRFSVAQRSLRVEKQPSKPYAIAATVVANVKSMGTQIVLPGRALKRDTRYQTDKKRKQCRRRATIEPIIGHLKSDLPNARNYLKGAIGDLINLLMAAVAWNLKQWLLAIFWFFFFPRRKLQTSKILWCKKIKSLDFVFINTPPFNTADLKKRLMQFFRTDYLM